jgi:hypothetical protein
MLPSCWSGWGEASTTGGEGRGPSERGRENTHIRAGGEKQFLTAAPEEQSTRASHTPHLTLSTCPPRRPAAWRCVDVSGRVAFPAFLAAIRPSPSHSPLSPSPLSPSSFTDHPRQPEALPERPDWQARRGQAEVGYGVQRCEQDGENKGDRSGPGSTAHSHFPLTGALSDTLSLSPQATWSPWTRT